eukprot:symbB.v1.2.033505.t1/scaffold4173.1/size43543/1
MDVTSVAFQFRESIGIAFGGRPKNCGGRGFKRFLLPKMQSLARPCTRTCCRARNISLVRDAPYLNAEKHITEASSQDLASCYEPMNQTLLFFAAARPVGQDAQALALCTMLLNSDSGIHLNHADVNGQTALFYAANQGHVETMTYLIAKGMDPNCTDKKGKTARFYANKRNKPNRLERVESEGETHVKKLRAWANEWPTWGRTVGKTFRYKVQDVVKVTKDKDFVVVDKALASIAARLRMSEKISLWTMRSCWQTNHGSNAFPLRIGAVTLCWMVVIPDTSPYHLLK